MKKTTTILLTFLLLLPIAFALTTNTVFNPFTSNFDYIRSEAILDTVFSSCADTNVLLYNDSSSSWYCGSACNASGDMTGVTTTDAWLSGGVNSGIANLLFNESHLNSWLITTNNISVNWSAVNNKPLNGVDVNNGLKITSTILADNTTYYDNTYCRKDGCNMTCYIKMGEMYLCADGSNNMLMTNNSANCVC